MVSSLKHTCIVVCFLTLYYLLCLQEHVEAIEIIIGGAGPSVPSPDPDNPGCLPPPPPPEPLCPPPEASPPPPEPLCPPPEASPPPPSPAQPSPHKKSPPPPPPKSTPSPRHPPPSSYFPFLNSNIKRDYHTIQAFKRTIKEDPFNITGTWNGPHVCETYTGILCDKLPPLFKKQAVAGINFNGFKLRGTLDGYVDRLYDLAIIHVNSNFFTGRVPRGIANLKYLYELDLSNNKFQGRFPNEVLGAKGLIFLDLRFNTFSGTLPPHVFNLPLLVLFLNNNNFAQKLPDSLGDSTAAYQTYANNKFSGSIPSSIGKAAKTLKEVLYLNNQLSGCLPYQIGLLRYATVFDVSFNQLRGPIPWSFGCLSKMEILVLARNQFSGRIPESLCTLPNLSNLSLSYNYYTEVGAECRKLISRNILDVKMNCILDLPNQRSKTDCFKFFNSKMPPCPDPKSFFYVPCGKQPYASNTMKMEPFVNNPAFSPSALTSYDYLSPQKKH